jgi:hypothetical protein
MRIEASSKVHELRLNAGYNEFDNGTQSVSFSEASWRKTPDVIVQTLQMTEQQRSAWNRKAVTRDVD